MIQEKCTIIGRKEDFEEDKNRDVENREDRQQRTGEGLLDKKKLEEREKGICEEGSQKGPKGRKRIIRLFILSFTQ